MSVVARLFVVAALLSLGLVPATGAAQTEFPTFMWEEEGVLSPMEIEAPPDEEDDEDLKPPDWCEVTGGAERLMIGAAAPDLDPGGVGTLSLADPPDDPEEELQEEIDAIGPEGNGTGDTGYCPPDPTIAAGPNNLMVGVNSTIASYSKAPTKQWAARFAHWLSPLTFDSSEEIPVPEAFHYYHPSLVYDEIDDRFLLTLAAVDAVPVPDRDPLRVGASSLLIVGVSETSSPVGTWCFYTIPASGFAHYPRIGYNEDFLYLTNNEYGPGDLTRNWASLYTIEKDSMLSCAPGNFTAFVRLLNPNGQAAFFVQPPTTAGDEPFHLISADEPHKGGVGVALTVWSVEDGEALTRQSVDVPSYRGHLAGVRQGCESGNGTLDPLEARLRNAVYHDGMLWASQVNSLSVFRTELRVYKVDVGSSTVVPTYQGTRYLTPAEDGSLRAFFNPSVMVGSGGDMVLTFNSSYTTDGTDETLTPSIWTTRWLAGESRWRIPTQRKGSDECYQHPPQPAPPFGSGQNGTLMNGFRWAESAGSSLDPDGSGVWVYNAYAAQNDEWGTWISKVEI